MKLALRVNPNRDELLVSMVKALAATALVLETEFPGLGDPRAPFSAKARFKLSDALEPDQEFVHIIGVDLVLSAFTDLLTLPAPHARSCDYFFGVRMQLSQTTRYTVPSGGYEGNIFSPSGSLATPHFSFVKSVDKGNDVITMRQRITLKRASVPHEEYGQFYENVQDLLEQSDVLVAFAKPDTSGMPTESAAAVREGTGRRGAGLLQRARNDLETGRYADAEALLEKALVADPQSGEAHYLLGVALGHLDQYQASAAAFKKARELGYRP
jgi:hypothetical protein